MESPVFGKLIEGPAFRDAIHIACAPVVASVKMCPGLRVGLNEDGEAEISSTIDCIGIVDPFLTEDVQPGQKFWLFLYPNTVTGIRHAWSHPAFTPKLPRRGE